MKPETIENRWDILYRDYPEVYDAFASVPYEPKMVDILQEKFNFKGKIVADIGSGSGQSTMGIAKYAEHVIGLEPEAAMRAEAEKNTVEAGLKNISYIDGKAEEMPLEDNSVDMVVALTATMYPPEDVIPVFVKESKRVVRPGGVVVSVDVAPGWYGGELAGVIDDPGADDDLQMKHQIFVEENGFRYLDVIQTSYYGTTEKMLETYGFIFGKKAIEYIKEHKLSQVQWKFRAYYMASETV
ncbi:MAG: class I SAM-dependent methyltransferase [Candidatus Bathyarchaeota archaeon]|nr:class I SAM-dependent methyltransferase [Candidatus Bathyarchaeota archaeon]